MIVVDTHALIWLDDDSPKLGRRARKALAEAFAAEALCVSSISFWECAMLADRGRLELPAPVGIWRNELLAGGLIELPVDGPTAILAAQLPIDHKDPADRFIAATALRRRATLVTADDVLLAGVGELRLIDARS